MAMFPPIGAEALDHRGRLRQEFLDRPEVPREAAASGKPALKRGCQNGGVLKLQETNMAGKSPFCFFLFFRCYVCSWEYNTDEIKVILGDELQVMLNKLTVAKFD